MFILHLCFLYSFRALSTLMYKYTKSSVILMCLIVTVRSWKNVENNNYSRTSEVRWGAKANVTRLPQRNAFAHHSETGTHRWPTLRSKDPIGGHWWPLCGERVKAKTGVSHIHFNTTSHYSHVLPKYTNFYYKKKTVVFHVL